MKFQSDRSGTNVFTRYWTVVTIAAAFLLSIVDALLLQRSKNYFTGGFLTIDYLTSTAEVLAFAIVSLLADAAVTGILAAVTILTLGRLGVRARATAVAAIFVSAGPLIVADIVSYELAAYVGDLLDLSLSLELAGGSVVEMFAVASAHLLVPALLIIGVGGAAGTLVWLTNRHSPGDRTIASRARNLAIPLAVAVVGLVLTTVASAESDSLENGLLRKPSGKVLAMIANALSDVDGDGFGVAGRQHDLALLDASVFPYAIDDPGNGIDEDGVAGDLPAATTAYVEPPVRRTPWIRHPDVVLIVLESYRADMIGAQFEGRPITPALNSLASRGVSSAHAYSHNGYTAPSRHHVFAGSLLGKRDDGRTLVDDFKEQGYLVGYFSGQDESFGAVQFRVGFERADVSYDARVDRDRRYTTFTTAGSLAVPFTVVRERVGEFLQNRGKTAEQLFLYVNFHDTHFPYSHDQVQTLTSSARLPRAAIEPEAREALWATYTNTAANVDRAVGEIIEEVRQVRGRTPAIIVMADHGESLFDEGFLGHGYALNDVQTRIPLIVTDLPMIIDEPFGQRDLRDAIIDAMTTPEVGPGPQLRSPEGRSVFQYLGNLTRPKQLALVRKDGRILYDFPSRRVRLAGGQWVDSAALPATVAADFLQLIHGWERMMLATRPSNASNN